MISRKKKSTPQKQAANVNRVSRKPLTAKKDISASYNKFKEFNGEHYTGMKVGRSHKWYYDKGEWKETKITPDLWQISYAVTKRRAGKAPEGSGVPTGTQYHWCILAHQMVGKLNANDYSTALTGFKYKVSHKRADKDKWGTTVKTQRKRLIKFLQDMIMQLNQDPIPLNIDYNGEALKGEALPVMETCHDGKCEELEITLNDEFRGIIRYLKSGWKLEGEPDKKLVKAIGEAIDAWYS
jgi:hypothetical protein